MQISLGRSALAPIPCVSVKGRGAFGSDFVESLLGKNPLQDSNHRHFDIYFLLFLSLHEFF